MKVVKNDNVRVLSGKYKDSTGKVLKVFNKNNRVIVEGVNVIKRHTKPSQKNQQGGIVEKEASIHMSNLSLLTSKGEATRVGYRMDGDNKIRFSKKSNEVI